MSRDFQNGKPTQASGMASNVGRVGSWVATMRGDSMGSQRHKKQRRSRRLNCVYATYTPEEVFEAYKPNCRMMLALPTGDEIFYKRTKMKGKRLACFNETLKCVQCGKKGTKFILYQNGRKRNNVIALKLLADDGDELTVDHIFPISKGGSDNLSNLQTMCATCNNKKGSSLKRSQISYTIGDILRHKGIVLEI